MYITSTIQELLGGGSTQDRPTKIVSRAIFLTFGFGAETTYPETSRMMPGAPINALSGG